MFGGNVCVVSWGAEEISRTCVDAREGVSFCCTRMVWGDGVLVEGAKNDIESREVDL